MNRRQALGAGAAGLGAFSTGCLQLAGRAGERVDRAVPERERLCRVALESEADEPHTAAVVVEQGDQVAQRSQFDLPPMQDPQEPPYGAVRREVERTWGTAPAYLALRGRVDGGEWRAFEFEGTETDACWLTTLRIDEQGDWGWMYSTRPVDEVVTASPTAE